MKITKSKLKQLIKEELSRILHEGKLYVTRSSFGGGYYVEDENDKYIRVGDMVDELFKSGDEAIFQSSEGAVVDEKALNYLKKKDKEGIQGGMQNWDADTFSNYYDVDIEAVLQKYAKLKGHEIIEN